MGIELTTALTIGLSLRHNAVITYLKINTNSNEHRIYNQNNYKYNRKREKSTFQTYLFRCIIRHDAKFSIQFKHKRLQMSQKRHKVFSQTRHLYIYIHGSLIVASRNTHLYCIEFEYRL